MNVPLSYIKGILGLQCVNAFPTNFNGKNIYLITIKNMSLEILRHKIASNISDPGLSIVEFDNFFDFQGNVIYVDPTVLQIENLVNSFFAGGWLIENGLNGLYYKISASRNDDCKYLACFLKYQGIVFSSSLEQFPVVKIINLPFGFNSLNFQQLNNQIIHITVIHSVFINNVHNCTGFIVTKTLQESFELVRKMNMATISTNQIEAHHLFLSNPQNLMSSSSSNESFSNHEVFSSQKSNQQFSFQSQQSKYQQPLQNQFNDFSQSFPSCLSRQEFQNQPYQNQTFNFEKPVQISFQPENQIDDHQFYGYDFSQIPQNPNNRKGIEEFANEINLNASSSQIVRIYPSSMNRTIIAKQPMYIPPEQVHQMMEKYGIVEKFEILSESNQYREFKVVFNKEGCCETIIRSKQFKDSIKMAPISVSPIATSPLIQFYPAIQPNQPQIAINYHNLNTVAVAFDKNEDLNVFHKKALNYGKITFIFYQMFEDRKEVYVTYEQNGSVKTFLNCKEYNKASALANELIEYRSSQAYENYKQNYIREKQNMQQQVPQDFGFSFSINENQQRMNFQNGQNNQHFGSSSIPQNNGFRFGQRTQKPLLIGSPPQNPYQ